LFLFLQWDDIANQKMNEGLDRIYVGYETYNIIHNTMHYDDTTKLDTAEAIKCFSLWYEQEKLYDYTKDPVNLDIGNFILSLMIFILN